jgi:sirohydrochlorin cobaltochelatase
MKNKAILVISSGTSNEKARRENIEVIEKRIAETFTGYEIRSAFTSHKILHRLKSQGIYIDNPLEAVRRLAEEDFEEVIIQPLHIIPGMEYEKVIRVAEQFKNSFKIVGVGRPLLFEERDFIAAITALKSHLPEMADQQAYALMGHGSTHTAQEYYSRLQNYLDKAEFKGYIGTIKGVPGINEVIERLKGSGTKEVVLVPFMLVAGNHALMDMASEEEDSWKSILTREGFKVSICLKGLGESKEYQDIYIDKIHSAIKEAEADKKQQEDIWK